MRKYLGTVKQRVGAWVNNHFIETVLGVTLSIMAGIGLYRLLRGH